jgi:hypothetical protein
MSMTQWMSSKRLSRFVDSDMFIARDSINCRLIFSFSVFTSSNLYMMGKACAGMILPNMPTVCSWSLKEILSMSSLSSISCTSFSLFCLEPSGGAR